MAARRGHVKIRLQTADYTAWSQRRNSDSRSVKAGFSRNLQKNNQKNFNYPRFPLTSVIACAIFTHENSFKTVLFQTSSGLATSVEIVIFSAAVLSFATAA